jgi:hypothetical protein
VSGGTAPASAQAGAVEQLRLLLGATIVTAGGRDWTGRDLVTAGALSGRWRTLEADLVRGLASLADWTPPGELVTAGLREFRYARRLISADEFKDWLRQRGLTQRELARAVGRRLARERGEQPGAPDCSGGSGQPGQRRSALAALPAEAVYTGALLDCGGWLADRVLCLAEGLVPTAEPAQLEHLLGRERELMASGVIDETDGDRRARAGLVLAASAVYDALVADVCSDRAIARLVQRHALDWLRFELTGFSCATAGAAAEIAALLREGTPAELITEVSGVPAAHQLLYLEETPEAIQGWLGGAVQGTVIGPVGGPDAHRTWLVRARRPADPEDPAIAAKARAEIVEEHMRKRRAGRVTWHERH